MENRESTIPVVRENIEIGGGAVNSVNGQTGDVVLDAQDVGALPDSTVIPTTVAELSDASDYAKKTEVAQDIGIETTARENADINLQGQIDAISAASDVTDVVGTYAALQAYDTSKLKDNDIIKVLQDESHSDETTYYRWSATTEAFTLIGEEGPYYTKAQTDTLLNAKQGTLTAGPNISIDANNEISATDTTYTAGANVQISDGVISATDTTYSNFAGTDGTSAGSPGLVPAPATTDAGKFLKADGTWGSAGGDSSIKTLEVTANTTAKNLFGDNNAVKDGDIFLVKNTSNDTRKISFTNNANATDITHYVMLAKGASALFVFNTAGSSSSMFFTAIAGRNSFGGTGYNSAQYTNTIVKSGFWDSYYGYVANPQIAGLQAATVDNLTTTATMNPLSANQGKILNDKITDLTPVGTVYSSNSATAPTFAGGTWTEIGTQTIGSATVHYYERTA